MKNKKKKGVMSVQAVISLLLAVALVSVLLDLLTLANRYMSLHDTVKELSRTIAVQGGCLENKPKGYPNNYYDAVTLGKLVDNSMKVGGFQGDYKVSITYTDFETNRTSGQVTLDKSYTKDFIVNEGGVQNIYPTDQIDYLKDFTVTIESSYPWMFSKIQVKQKPLKISSAAPGVSEWKYDYDHWDSEETADGD